VVGRGNMKWIWVENIIYEKCECAVGYVRTIKVKKVHGTGGSTWGGRNPRIHILCLLGLFGRCTSSPAG
jgi:hypothetical protein